MATSQPIFLITSCLLLLLVLAAATTPADDDDSSSDAFVGSAPLPLADFHEYTTEAPPQPQQPYLESLWEVIAERAQEFGVGTMILAVAILDSVPFVPTQPAAVVAGAVLGFPIGLPVVMIGQGLATALAMWIGRYLLASSSTVSPPSSPQYSRCATMDTDCSDDTTIPPLPPPPRDDDDAKTKPVLLSAPKLARVMEELASGLHSDDWKTVFGTILLARQSPVLPFSLGNYVMGASTRAPIPPVVLATMVGCIPLNCVFVGAGAGGTAAMEALQEHDSLAKGIQLVGVLATAAIVGLVGKIIYKVWNEDESSPKLELLSEKEKDLC